MKQIIKNGVEEIRGKTGANSLKIFENTSLQPKNLRFFLASSSYAHAHNKICTEY